MKRTKWDIFLSNKAQTKHIYNPSYYVNGYFSCKIGVIDSTHGINTSDGIDTSDSRAYESVSESGVEEGMESHSDADSGAGIITPLTYMLLILKHNFRFDVNRMLRTSWLTTRWVTQYRFMSYVESECRDCRPYRRNGTFCMFQFIVVSLKDGMFNNANVLFRTKFVDGMSTVSRTVNKVK